MAEQKKAGWKNLAFAVLMASMSALQHGFNTGVLNNSQESVTHFIGNVTSHRVTGTQSAHEATATKIFPVLNAVYCIGGAIGGMASGFVLAKLGFKRGLLWNNVPVLVAALLFFFSKMADSYEMLIVGRLIIGFNNGLGSGLAPTYSTELSPTKTRGLVGSVYQFFLTIAIVLAQVLGINELLGSDERWPYLFALILVPAVIQVIGLSFCSESPKQLLIARNNEEAAQKALIWLRGTPDVQDEMQTMRDEAEQIKQSPKVTLKEMFSNPVYWQPLKIAMVIMLSQQLSGINAAIGYSTQIFVDAGISKGGAQWVSVGMGLVNVATTMISVKLVDKFGRRALLLSGMGGMTVMTIFLAITLSLKHMWDASKFIGIVLVYLFVISFAIGPGSIPWFVVGEMFGIAAKEWATSIATGINWTAASVVLFTFPYLNDALGPTVFLVFTILLIVFFCYVYKRVPETKGRTIEEVTSIFRK